MHRIFIFAVCVFLIEACTGNTYNGIYNSVVGKNQLVLQSNGECVIANQACKYTIEGTVITVRLLRSNRANVGTVGNSCIQLERESYCR